MLTYYIVTDERFIKAVANYDLSQPYQNTVYQGHTANHQRAGLISESKRMKQVYLSLVHSDQTLVDFRPCRNSTDIPQLVGVFSKWTCLHL